MVIKATDAGRTLDGLVVKDVDVLGDGVGSDGADETFFDRHSDTPAQRGLAGVEDGLEGVFEIESIVGCYFPESV